LRTVERFVKPFRQELVAMAKATLRYETPPGHQLQIDFGAMRVPIGAELVKMHLFVATLGYSRRPFVTAFLHERQSAWFVGIEEAFSYFEGVPEQVLLDNPKTLVTHHDSRTREVIFNERFQAFARYWGFCPRACAPYRARTKGKDESGVRYVKGNAIAGHGFISFEDLRSHLTRWMREVADTRVHGTTGERPIDRFDRAEKEALKALNGRAPFQQNRELRRVVASDACVEVETNAYSVPWRLIGQQVTVQVSGCEVFVFDGAEEVARHPICTGRRQRVIERSHLTGIFKTPCLPESPPIIRPLLRPLSEYEAVAGGAF
jgi:hypothetical protein